ncbi:MAG: insulinase family protein [Arenibacter algicola]
MINKTITSGLLLIFLVISILIQAKITKSRVDPLPLDPGIRYGRLENGFTYYIKSLSTPGPRTYMRLTIKAGTFQEDADQSQLAHFTEHMPHIRTKNFTNILYAPDLLKSLDMKLNDISARTDGTNTNYWFDHPTGSVKALDTGLLYFHDIVSGNVEFRKEDVDGERKAFFQEYVLRDGKKNYVDNTMMSHIVGCSVLQPHPVDFREYIQTFDPDALSRFYLDWYRPDMAALTVVGNIDDVDALERKIQTRFSDIKIPENPRPWQNCQIDYLNRPEQFIVLENPYKDLDIENEEVTIRTFIRDINYNKSTWQGLEWKLAKSLFQELLRERYGQALKHYNLPYKIYNHIEANPSAMEIRVITKKGKEKLGVQTAFGILREIRNNGFTQAEWKKARQYRLQQLDDTNDHSPYYWVKQIENHFVEGEALPKDKTAHLKKWMTNLSLEKFNNMVNDFLDDMPEDIAIIAPIGHKANSYSREDLEQWIQKAKEVPNNKHNPNDRPKVIIEAKQSALLQQKEIVSITTRNEKPGMEIKEVVLQNGMKVVLQPGEPSKDGRKEKIQIHGFSTKGASGFPKREYFSAIFAPDIVRNAGVGTMDKFDLEHVLSGTSFPYGVHPYIDYYETGIKGEAALEDLESIFQLIYLYFTDPRKDIAAYKDWKELERNAYLNPTYSIPAEDMNTSIREHLQDSTISPQGTKRFKGLKYTDWNKAYEIYNLLFGQASDFTFLINGNFPENKVLSLVNKYLGNLPNRTKDQTVQTNKRSCMPLQKGPINIHLVPNSPLEEVQIKMEYIREADNIDQWQEQIRVDALAKVISFRLRELRYLYKRAVYFPRSSGYVNKYLQRNVVSLNIDSSPEDLEFVKSDIKNILNELKSTPVNEGIFHDAVLRFLYPKYSRDNLQRNKNIIVKLYNQYRFGEPWVNPDEVEEFVKTLTTKDIMETAKKYLNDEYLFEFVLKNKDTPNIMVK